MRNLRLALGSLAIALASASGPGGPAAAELPNLDDPQVQYELGMSHIRGPGRNPPEAVTWLRKAALRGHAEAQVQLGVCYQQGFGIEKDLAQALAWFRRAAEQGNPRGQLQVGLAYRRGEGVAADLAQATAYIRKAAEGGHPKAQIELGLAYRDGRGVAADPEQAAFWLGLAAAKGSPAARALATGARGRLNDEQRAALDARLEAWQRDHRGAAAATDS
jgi:TPR repeat protein